MVAHMNGAQGNLNPSLKVSSTVAVSAAVRLARPAFLSPTRQPRKDGRREFSNSLSAMGIVTPILLLAGKGAMHLRFSYS